MGKAVCPLADDLFTWARPVAVLRQGSNGHRPPPFNGLPPPPVVLS